MGWRRGGRNKGIAKWIKHPAAGKVCGHPTGADHVPLIIEALYPILSIF